MENFTPKIELYNKDMEIIILNGAWVDCETPENARYLVSLEEKLAKAIAENKDLLRRLNDLQDTSIYYRKW